MPIVTLRRSRAGNGRIESLIRVAGHHQNHGTYFEQGRANSYFDPLDGLGDYDEDFDDYEPCWWVDWYVSYDDGETWEYIGTTGNC